MGVDGSGILQLCSGAIQDTPPAARSMLPSMDWPTPTSSAQASMLQIAIGPEQHRRCLKLAIENASSGLGRIGLGWLAQASAYAITATLLLLLHELKRR